MIIYFAATILWWMLLHSLFSHIFLFNPLNAELNPICHFLALLGAHHILHVSRIRVKIKAWKLLSQLGELVKGEFTVVWEMGSSLT